MYQGGHVYSHSPLSLTSLPIANCYLQPIHPCRLVAHAPTDETANDEPYVPLRSAHSPTDTQADDKPDVPFRTAQHDTLCFSLTITIEPLIRAILAAVATAIRLSVVTAHETALLASFVATVRAACFLSKHTAEYSGTMHCTCTSHR